MASKKKGNVGGGGGRKKKKTVGVVASTKETLLSYRIEMKEKTIEDLSFEVRELEMNIARYKKQNSELIAEQNRELKSVAKKMHSERQEERAKKWFTDDDIKQAEEELDKWKLGEEARIKKLQGKLTVQRKATGKLLQELEGVKRFKGESNSVSEEDAKIKALEEEQANITDRNVDTKTAVEATITKMEIEIGQQLENRKEDTIRHVLQNCIATLDDKHKRQIMDNDWLKKEVESFTSTVSDMKAKVNALENEVMVLHSLIPIDSGEGIIRQKLNRLKLSNQYSADKKPFMAQEKKNRISDDDYQYIKWKHLEDEIREQFKLHT